MPKYRIEYNGSSRSPDATPRMVTAWDAEKMDDGSVVIRDYAVTETMTSMNTEGVRTTHEWRGLVAVLIIAPGTWRWIERVKDEDASIAPPPTSIEAERNHMRRIPDEIDELSKRWHDRHGRHMMPVRHIRLFRP